MAMRLIIFLAICVFASGPILAKPITQPLSQLVSAPVLSGDKVSQKWLSGKLLVVTFFASWCPPCRHEFEQLSALKHHARTHNTNIIAVNVFEDEFGSNPNRLQHFLKLTRPNFPVIKGNAEMRKAFGNITRIPTLIIYDASGREAWRFIHERGAQKMSAELDEILAALKQAAK